MIKKVIIGLSDLLGVPYYAVLIFIKGLKFAIREGGRTVGAGVVSKIVE